LADIAQVLAQAKSYHRSGQLHDAEQFYRQALAADARHPEALYLLGGACQAQGKINDAVAFLERAVAEQPGHAEARHDLGIALGQQGRLGEAVAQLQEANRLRPGEPEFVQSLRAALAAYHLQQAQRLEQFDQAEAHNNRSIVLKELGRLDEAVTALRRAIELKPEYVDAHVNLGIVLATQEKYAEAEAVCRRALALAPDHVKALCNVSVALLRQKKFVEAEVAARRFVELAPDSAEAHGNLAVVFADQDRFTEAEDCFQRALAIDPRSVQTHRNMAMLLVRQSKLEAAIEHRAQALAIDPNEVETHFENALGLLQMGQFEAGWREYEWRFRRKGNEEGNLPRPRWDGSPLFGRTILLRPEQGLGDTMQFVRYAEMVKEQGATVVVECPRSLARLLASCACVDAIVVEGEPRPPYDVHFPLMSLPRMFNTSLENIPDRVPYLAPNTEEFERWTAELSGTPALKIGIAWRGSPTNINDRYRSFPLTEFTGIARMPGIQLYSLQMGAGREQLSSFEDPTSIIDLGDRLGDFCETAAIVSNLDLVITCDSAPAHLAGALGVHVWVALPSAPDWRWLVERSDSPWYPTMRLFRQTSLGDWQGVFGRIEQALADRIPA
jgi:tetratricopeptide (TPR) repeat protein